MNDTTLYRNRNDRPALTRPDMEVKLKKLDRFVEQLLMVAVVVATMTAMLFFISLA